MQVVEIHRVGGLQRRAQRRVTSAATCASRSKAAACEQLRRALHPVLGRGDDRLHRARRGTSWRNAPCCSISRRMSASAVVLVVDRELPGEAQQLAPRAAAAGPRGEWKVPIQSPTGPGAGAGPIRCFISPAALLVKVTAKMRSGGTPCCVDQARDARREHPGLARPRARQHQQRPVDVLHRLPLGRDSVLAATPCSSVSSCSSLSASGMRIDEAWYPATVAPASSAPAMRVLARRGARGPARCPSRLPSC